MKKYKFTYQKSGVNINASNQFIKYISKLTKKGNPRNKFKNIGGFGSINEIPKKFNNPLLVSSTDGVGTKLEIANVLNKFNTIGIDLVAMCVNDILVQGAKPLLFLDYISIDKLNLPKLKSIIRGIHKGCKISDCQLVGGETAEMPGTYSKNKFDLAGFSVGVVNKNNLLKKERVKENDLILAVPSSGLHSNGYSLLREILKRKKINIKKDKFLRNEILKPTKIYVKEIMSLLNKKLINGCANITGGGIGDNIERVIPQKLCARIDLDKIKTHKIFSWINKNGVSQKEMLKTFNCGVGFCLIIKKNNFHKILKFFPNQYRPYIIGKVIKNKGRVKYTSKIRW
tara:strand:- start:813 stop:1838 length:1026 start_codon:yes stop_codon:yes gene_type:complete